jgi:hypothetical protein
MPVNESDSDDRRTPPACASDPGERPTPPRLKTARKPHNDTTPQKVYNEAAEKGILKAENEISSKLITQTMAALIPSALHLQSAIMKALSIEAKPVNRCLFSTGPSNAESLSDVPHFELLSHEAVGGLVRQRYEAAYNSRKEALVQNPDLIEAEIRGCFEKVVNTLIRQGQLCEDMVEGLRADLEVQIGVRSLSPNTQQMASTLTGMIGC